jgi:hypothetical protein
MIEAIKGPQNVCLALCRCDSCGAETSFNALHVAGKGGSAKLRKLALREPGMVNKSLIDRGWSVSPRGVTCPQCKQAKKTPQPIKEFAAMAANVHPIAQPGLGSVTELRTPTREQKRQIIDMLTAVYDTKASRYTGAETDLTVAEAIGGGILFGWVGQQREDLFGPAGGNAEMETLRDDLLKLVDTYGTQLARVNAQITEATRILDVLRVDRGELAKVVERVAAMSTKLERICKSVGPKGAL